MPKLQNSPILPHCPLGVNYHKPHLTTLPKKTSREKPNCIVRICCPSVSPLHHLQTDDERKAGGRIELSTSKSRQPKCKQKAQRDRGSRS
ncbi:hypothetical protein KC19_1G189700 [Ceratodon purpureus]|uniref:Uncharacterized protein n=1 Tax=Ceratodon purpureus TaxID=3225 RepID=A0A8T0J9U6_CERPU|nr:hypothetical protein KC19_1G189700 [Ceratodon purpureus]